MNVSNVAVAELLHEGESDTVESDGPHGTDEVRGGFVHDQEVLVLVDDFDRVVQHGRLVQVQNPRKVVPFSHHDFTRISSVSFEGC